MPLEPLDAARWREERTGLRWKRRRDIPLAILAWLGVTYAVLWSLGRVFSTLFVLVIAALLAFALAPAVKILQRIMPRFLAILVVYLLVLGLIVFVVYLIINTAIVQFASLSHSVSYFLTPGKNGQATPLETTLQSLGISQSQITTARNQIVASIEGLAGSVVPLLSGVFGFLLDVVIVAVLSIYLLIDGGRVVSWLRNNMPAHQQGRVHFLLNTLERVVGGYIRGQLLLSALIGVLVGVGMALFHVPYAVLLGVLAFILEFIPILGTLVSGAICVLIALTQGWLIALGVLAYFVVVHVLEGDVIGPRIVGKAVGLHPVVSIAALIAGAELFGIVGALLASPVAGMLQALVIAIWSEWRANHPREFEQAKVEAGKMIEENLPNQPVGPS